MFIDTLAYFFLVVMAAVRREECRADVTGLEDKEEFDAAAKLVKTYCKPITEEEFEEQGASETEKALEVHIPYLFGYKMGFSPSLE